MFLFKKRFWIPIVILLTFVLLLVAFPASWLIYGIQQAAPGFQVSGVSGSLWRGEVQLSQWVSRGHNFPLGRLTWRLSPASLVMLNPCVRFTALASNQSIQGQGCFSLFSSVAVAQDLDFTIPAERIAPFLNASLDGVYEGYVHRATWSNQGLGDSELTVLWQDGQFHNGDRWVKLGDLQIQAEDDANGGLVGKMNSVEPVQQATLLGLDLDFSLSNLTQSSPKYRLNGEVYPKPQPGIDWAPVMNMIGDRIPGNGWRISISE